MLEKGHVSLKEEIVLLGTAFSSIMFLIRASKPIGLETQSFFKQQKRES